MRYFFQTKVAADDEMEINDVVTAEDDVDYEDRQEEARRKALKEKKFDLKRLIRLLHIQEPVYHVMAILGKR